MTLRFLRDGRASILNTWLRGAAPPAAFVVRLFAHDIIPSAADAAGLYTTNEANFTGYSPVSIPAWNILTDISNVANSQGNPVVFSCGNPVIIGNPIYGYFISPLGDLAKVLWAERFVTVPIMMAVPARAILIIPNFSGQSLFS